MCSNLERNHLSGNLSDWQYLMLPDLDTLCVQHHSIDERCAMLTRELT